MRSRAAAASSSSLWIAAGREFDLVSIGPEAISLRTAVSLAPCEGCVVMTVDGHERVWNVSLPEGAVVPNRLVPVQRL